MKLLSQLDLSVSVSVNHQHIMSDYLRHCLHAAGHFDASEFFKHCVKKLKRSPQNESVVGSIFCRRMMLL